MTDLTPITLPLDASLYNLKEDEVAFFKDQTGIQDPIELRNHILQVQSEAYAVHPYPCIRRFVFTSFKISRYPAYENILKLGKERPGSILLDLGCCLGNDVRKAVADGFPRENVIACDLHAEFWTLGHGLYKTSQETYPVCFLPGDIFNPSFLSPNVSPVPSSSTSPQAGHPPSLSTLTSLIPLQHHISIIHTSAFFHLFSEPEQRTLAYLLATLLSPLPGSMILGSHMGLPDTDENKAGGMRRTGRGTMCFAHSPTSWQELWVGRNGIFKPENVSVWTEIEEYERKDIIQAGGNPGIKAYILIWSITRA